MKCRLAIMQVFKPEINLFHEAMSGRRASSPSRDEAAMRECTC